MGFEQPKIEIEEAGDLEGLEPILLDEIHQKIEQGRYDEELPEANQLAQDIMTVFNEIREDKRIDPDTVTSYAFKNAISSFCEELMQARYAKQELDDLEIKEKMAEVRGIIDTQEPDEAPTPERTLVADESSYREKRGQYFMQEQVANYAYDQDDVLLGAINWDKEKMKLACEKFLKEVEKI